MELEGDNLVRLDTETVMTLMLGTSVQNEGNVHPATGLPKDTLVLTVEIVFWIHFPQTIEIKKRKMKEKEMN